MDRLKDKEIISCNSQGELTSLSKDEMDKFFLELDQDWGIKDGYLQRKFKFPNFKDGLKFVNEVGKISDQEKHHPIIELSWGKVIVKLRTVKIHDISINDFILAAKIDEIKQGS